MKNDYYMVLYIIFGYADTILAGWGVREADLSSNFYAYNATFPTAIQTTVDSTVIATNKTALDTAI